MLELLIAFGLPLLLKIGIGDIIALSGLAKGLIGKIGEKDALKILKKALYETIKKSEDGRAKVILENLKKNDKILRELRKLDVSEEAKKSLVSQYFSGREDVFEDLAKNYSELFCKKVTKKDGTFKEFVVTELWKLANQGVITEEVVENVKRYLEGIIEEIKREKEAASRQFLITDDLKAVSSEILAGKLSIEYVERKELEEVKDALENTNKLLVVGKPGAGKSRFLLRLLKAFNGYEKFVVIRSFFREDGIRSLDAELQQLNSFILVWDDLHRAKNEIVNQTINQIEQLAKDYGKEYLFIGASRMECEYYQYKQEEIKLDDFRSLELIEKCSAYFGVSVEGVKEELLEVGDGTPFYVVSLFATSKERGKKRLTEDDLKALPDDSFKIWRDHLNFLESAGRLSTSEKNVLRSIALALRAVPAIDFAVLEKFYAQIFRGDLSEFDYALDEVVKKFFIGIEGEHCSVHAVQAAVVDEKYPLKDRKIDRLKDVLASLEKERSLKLLWGFAIWFYESKKYEDCLNFLNDFIEKEPNMDTAYNNRGNAYAKLNEHERAIADFNKTIELNPSYANAYYNRGNTYAELNEHERAIADFNKAIELSPNDAQAYNNRGNAYYGLNEHERAIADYNKAIELSLNDVWVYTNRGNAYYGLNEHERAIADYNKAIELSSNDVEAYYNRGNAYYGLNEHERAIADYNKAIELNPNFVEAYNNRSLAYSGLGQHGKAIADYNKAIERNPNFAMAYYNRGNTYAKLNEHERAIADYNKAIELNSSDAQAYTSRGVAYAELNEHERAIADYNKAIGLNPSYVEAYYNRGNAYYRLNEHERAIRDYNKTIELSPNDTRAYTNRGNAYYGLNEHERAIADYNKVIELNSSDAQAYTNRGVAYAGLNEHERAIADFNKAIELNPNFVRAYYNRGIIYAGLNEHERAIEDYNKAIELNPNDAEAYGNRGTAYSKIGRYEESARDLKEAGILFFDSGSEEGTVKTFSFCFGLRDEIESNDTIYCGLALFLITLNPDVIITLRRMQIEDENLRKIHKLTLKKLQNEDISEDVAAFEREDEREEIKILLGLLKRF